jgi:hypothetical protein
MKLELRQYQQDCLLAIVQAGPGRWLVQMATGLGKTVVFSQLREQRICSGRMLIISHREELVRQPIKYFNEPVGIEMASSQSGTQKVISASIQSLSRRLEYFYPTDFEMIIIDEAHHAAASSYKKVLDYFKPQTVLGFTATPNRGDNVRLNDVFDSIIFQRDLKWGIENKYLANLDCMRINIGYDLSKCRSKLGDYEINDLADAVNIESANKAISEIVDQYAIAPVLIFSVNVNHCFALQNVIPDSEVIVADTKDKSFYFQQFRNGKIKCLINCMIATEGTDLPNVRTVIMVRPTQSISLYQQMVGRGTRKTHEKDKCLLIDCVGNTQYDLCTAPSLIGIDASNVPANKQLDIRGDLLKDLAEQVEKFTDVPECWIKNVSIVNIFAKKNKINLYDINFVKLANGEMCVYLPKGAYIKISCLDQMGKCYIYTRKKIYESMSLQECIFNVRQILDKYAEESKPLWCLSIFKRWGNQNASDSQLRIIRNKYPEMTKANLTKGEASLILNRIFN